MTRARKPPMPPELKEKIARALLKSAGVGPIEAPEEGDEDVTVVSSEGSDIGDLLNLLATRRPRRLATAEEVAFLNKPQVPPLRVGDRVKWRSGFAIDGMSPDDNEIGVVSQVIDPPLRDMTSPDQSSGAMRNDIAIAFVQEGEGGLLRFYEFVYDSRSFERVEE